jgi:hypothetical protein
MPAPVYWRAPFKTGPRVALHDVARLLPVRVLADPYGAAAGARPRRQFWTGRDALTPNELTPNELTVARMAAEGRTSQEIAQSRFCYYQDYRHAPQPYLCKTEHQFPPATRFTTCTRALMEGDIGGCQHSERKEGASLPAET